jgi:hypothetical protein
MRKKHFLILGRVGLIYFSWLLIIFFLSWIFAFEGTKVICYPAIICMAIFVLLIIYTYFNSYWNAQSLKLPFKSKIITANKPKLYSQHYWFKIYRIRVTDIEKYYLLRIEKK